MSSENVDVVEQKEEVVIIPQPEEKEKATEEVVSVPSENSASETAQAPEEKVEDKSETGKPTEESKEDEDKEDEDKEDEDKEDENKEDEDDEEEDEEEEVDAEAMISMISKMLGLRVSSATNASAPPAPPAQKVLPSLDIDGIADYIKSGKCKKIVVMTGAGVSVAAGIPDFRTPGTGLYDNLQKYNLPYPTAVFEIDYFMKSPQPFYLLAKELYPGNFKPTHAHFFIRLLHEKGLLLRNYTQNIDTLERCAGVDENVLVEAHGTFATAHCVICKRYHTHSFVKEHVFSDKIPYCIDCKEGLVKPDIVFFGESLPTRFFDLARQDFADCDLLIVVGTSLQVQPFASLIKRVSVSTPRLLINREEVGTSYYFDPASTTSGGFHFDHPANIRDVKWLGDCQDGVKKLASLLGWEQELEELVLKATGEPKFD